MNIFEENKHNYFIEKVKIKYDSLNNDVTNKLSDIFLELLKKEDKRINNQGLNLEDEPFILLKKIDEIFLNLELKSNILLKFLCIYDPSIKKDLYNHVNFLIEKILKELDYPFTTIGNERAQEKILRISFKIHNIGKLLIPKILFDKNVILEDKDKMLLEKQISYTKAILEDLRFGKQILDICLGANNVVNECYLTDMKKCRAELSSKIIIILDKYFALISDKPYRESFSKLEAIEIIRQEIDVDDDNRKILEIIKNNV